MLPQMVTSTLLLWPIFLSKLVVKAAGQNMRNQCFCILDRCGLFSPCKQSINDRRPLDWHIGLHGVCSSGPVRIQNTVQPKLELVSSWICSAKKETEDLILSRQTEDDFWVLDSTVSASVCELAFVCLHSSFLGTDWHPQNLLPVAPTKQMTVGSLNAWKNWHWEARLHCFEKLFAPSPNSGQWPLGRKRLWNNCVGHFAFKNNSHQKSLFGPKWHEVLSGFGPLPSCVDLCPFSLGPDVQRHRMEMKWSIWSWEKINFMQNCFRA